MGTRGGTGTAHVRSRALIAAAAGFALALVGVLAPIAVPPAAAEPVDLSITASGPESPLPVGTPFDVVFTPVVADPLASFTVTYAVPSGVELLDTASPGSLGDRTCSVAGRTVTCAGSGADTAPWTLRLLASGARSATHTFTITGDEPDPQPDPTPNTATVVTSGVASTKDVAVSPTNEPVGTVGEPMEVALTVSDVPTPAGDPAWGVRGFVGIQLPPSFDVVSVERIATSPPDPDATGPHFDQTQCNIIGQTVGCFVTSDLADDIFSVTVIPTAAGTWNVTGSYQAGTSQSEPAPDPRSNFASWYAVVAPGTVETATIVGTVDGGIADNPIGGVQVAAFVALGGYSPVATTTTGADGRFTLSDLDPGSYHLLFTPPDASEYEPQWYRSDGVASVRTEAHAVALGSAGAPVVADVTLQDLAPYRIDLGGGHRTFEGTDPVVVAGEEAEVVLVPEEVARTINGSPWETGVTTYYTVTVPPSVEITAAAPRWGAGGQPGWDESWCTVTSPQRAWCSLDQRTLEIVLDLRTDVAGTFSLTAEHTSTRAEAVPDVLPNTVTIPVDVTTPGPGSISGALELTGTGVPLSNVWVFAYRPTDGYLPEQAQAYERPDATGRFTFSGLLPDDYRLMVLIPNNGPADTQWLDERTGRATATVFTVGGGEALDIGTRPVAPRYGIAGRVTAGGSSVEGATVRAFDVTSPWPAVATTTTDTVGDYHLDLAPGDYVVQVSGPFASGLTTVWYAGVASRRSATAVTAATGLTGGIDVDLGPAAVVSGTVSGPGGPVAGAQVIFYAAADGYAGSYRTTTGPDGSYAMHRLAADSYRVLVVPPAGSGLAPEWYEDADSRWTGTPIATAGAPVPGVDVVLGP